MTWISIATEDELSEAVAEKLIITYTAFRVHNRLGKRGNGYLKSKLQNFCSMAQREPFLLITDLDATECAPSKILDWTNNHTITLPPNMIFRIASRQIEAWLLADHQGMQTFLGAQKLPTQPDIIPDSKKFLLNLAKKAPRAIRDDLILANRAVASQGIGYNARLSNFVNTTWCPHRASSKSNSLLRACNHLQKFSDTYFARST